MQRKCVYQQCLEKRLTHGRKALPVVMCECKETSEEDSLYDQVLRAIEAQTPPGENVRVFCSMILILQSQRYVNP